MDANSLQLQNIFLLKQDILARIGEMLPKDNSSVTEISGSIMKVSIEKKLKSASIRYKITRPLSILMGVLFTVLCLTQIFELNFYFKWEKAALFLFTTFSFSIGTINQKWELERYKQLLYLLNMLERLESIEKYNNSQLQG